MDLESAWKIVEFIVLPTMGWIMNTIWVEQKDILNKIHSLSVKIPETYATKMDVKQLGEQIMDRFDKLDDKLDKKADKNGHSAHSR